MLSWIISDTHSLHNQLQVPEADMVIHCGDWTNHFDPVINLREAEQFLDWYAGLEIPTKILIDGNHSQYSKKFYLAQEIADREIIYLQHEAREIEGIKFFGSPYSPRFGGDWSLTYKRNRGQDVWGVIPEDTEIVISHSPAKSVLDLAFDREDPKRIVQVGCTSLSNKLLSLPNLRFHFAGHIHSNGPLTNTGIYYNGKFATINASCKSDHKQNLTSNGFLLDISKPLL